MDLRRFLQGKITGLSARLSRLGRVDNAFVGLRPQDMPYAPSARHFAVANGRLANVERRIRERFAQLAGWERMAPQRVLIDVALVERELDRARRLFGMFYEVFAQRGTSYGNKCPASPVQDSSGFGREVPAATKNFRGRCIGE